MTDIRHWISALLGYSFVHHLVTAAFLLGLLSFALKMLDRRLSAGAKRKIDMIAQDWASKCLRATPESIRTWLWIKTIDWPFAEMIVGLLFGGILATAFYLMPFNISSHTDLVVKKTCGGIACTLLILGGVLLGIKIVRDAEKNAESQPIWEIIGGIIGAVIVSFPDFANQLVGIHELGIGYTKGMFSYALGFYVVVVLIAATYKSAAPILLRMFRAVRYPLVWITRSLMSVATSPLGAWGQMYLWTTTALEVVNLARALL